MNIKRQYNLPNCTLVLDGLSNDGSISQSGQPLMSILLNAECHFLGTNQTNKTISGGRAFLESLVAAVSAYGQECLSGLHHPQESKEEGGKLDLTPGSKSHLHRLTWEPPAEENGEKVEIELTTVQLFDLVEAVDRLFADSETLPDLTVPLQSVSKRYRQSEEPLLHRAAPPIVGIGSFLLTAATFFFLPVPEVPKPEEPKLEENTTETIPGIPEPIIINPETTGTTETTETPSSDSSEEINELESDQ